MHYFSGGAFDSLISSQLLKNNMFYYTNFQTVDGELPIFPSTYTVIYGLLDDGDNSKLQNFEVISLFSQTSDVFFHDRICAFTPHMNRQLGNLYHQITVSYMHAKNKRRKKFFHT